MKLFRIHITIRSIENIRANKVGLILLSIFAFSFCHSFRSPLRENNISDKKYKPYHQISEVFFICVECIKQERLSICAYVGSA